MGQASHFGFLLAQISAPSSIVAAAKRAASLGINVSRLVRSVLVM